MTDLNQQNKVLRDCTERLERVGIEYMLTGLMALAHYAMPRITAHIDVVIEISETHANKIIRVYEPDYYVPHDTVRQAIARRSMFNLLHQQSLVKIDCIVRKNDDYQKAAFARRQSVDYAGAGFYVWIISKEDLILSKLVWAKKTDSEMQRRDVANILRHGHDWEYLKNWTAKLGIEEMLENILKGLKPKNAV